ncbi:MAG: PrsW family intramembrane metalloprotease [Bacteroidota bacterium]
MGTIIFVCFCLLAIFIAWIWIDYFRLIDVFEKEKLKYVALMFAMGGAIVPLVLVVYEFLLNDSILAINGNFINDFFYCFLKIGMVEELAKIIPFFIFYLIFKNKFNEPIDFIIYISVSALGFSAVENILYFNIHGSEIIAGRAILSTVGHMFNTSIFAYGIIQLKYLKKSKNYAILAIYFLLAAFSHAFYDFWLIYEGIPFGFLITILYFLYTISIYSIVLNNALNYSPFFTYKKVVDSNKVSTRLLTYYGIVFFVQFLIICFAKNLSTAVYNLKYTLYTTGIIVIISCLRLSRFKLKKNHWELLKFELPFSVSIGDRLGMKSSKIIFTIKGESSNDALITMYYQENFTIRPLSTRRTYIGEKREAYMQDKVFLKNNEAFYLIKINFDECETEQFLLKTKVNGDTLVNKKYPIAALLKINDINDIENSKLTSSDFAFIEWVFLTE